MATNEPKLTKQQMSQVIIDGGRATATDLMEAAVSTARTPAQMMNALHVLRAAAIHILGTWIYNDVKQTNMTPEQSMEIIMKSIRGEFDLINQHNPSFLEPGERIIRPGEFNA